MQRSCQLGLAVFGGSLSGISQPATVLNSVDLAAPFGPKKPTIAFGGSLRCGTRFQPFQASIVSNSPQEKPRRRGVSFAIAIVVVAP